MVTMCVIIIDNILTNKRATSTELSDIIKV